MQWKAQLQKQLCQHQGVRAAHMATAMGTNGMVEKYWSQLISERLTPKIMCQALTIGDTELQQAPKLKMLHGFRERERRKTTTGHMMSKLFPSEIQQLALLSEGETPNSGKVATPLCFTSGWTKLKRFIEIEDTRLIKQTLPQILFLPASIFRKYLFTWL